MRRPGKLRFSFSVHRGFKVLLNASGPRPVQRQVSVCKARLGLELVTTVKRLWNETLRLDLETYFRLPSPNLHKVFSSLTPDLCCVDSLYPKFKEIGCVSL